MGTFLKNLGVELASQGKLLVGYVITQAPGVTSFPGLTTAVTTAVTDHTPASYFDVGAQIFLALAAIHRVGKIVDTAKVKSA